MAEFKKGDRVVFTKDDSWWERGELVARMPKGTLGTYVDAPGEGAPWVRLDTGAHVRAWADAIAPSEDHGTGDGSASDICAEPGCNCDLERRFPAPLDPSKVKAGDTVTVRVEPNPGTGWGTLDHGPEAIEVTGKVWLHAADNPHGPVAKVGAHALDLPNVTITHHQPAPEPEPEWKPGTVLLGNLPGVGTDERYWVVDDGETDPYVVDDTGVKHYAADLLNVREAVVIDPADVDVEALTKIADEACSASWSEFRDDGFQAAVLAVLEHLGLNR